MQVNSGLSNQLCEHADNLAATQCRYRPIEVSQDLIFIAKDQSDIACHRLIVAVTRQRHFTDRVTSVGKTYTATPAL